MRSKFLTFFRKPKHQKSIITNYEKSVNSINFVSIRHNTSADTLTTTNTNDSLKKDDSSENDNSLTNDDDPTRITDGRHGYTLNHTRHPNIIIPAYGFGTWGVNHFDNNTMAKAVDCAIKTGYRHFDCARIYANEEEIGEVLSDNIKNGIIRRDEIWITSKLYNDEHLNAYFCINETLKKLKLDYLDCFMIHWPFRNHSSSPPVPFKQIEYNGTYKAMHELMCHRLTRSIGISNCSVTKLRSLMDFCKKNSLNYPSINQIELHPYLQQNYVKTFCLTNGIMISSAMPLGSPERPERFRRDDDPILLNDPIILEISQNSGYSPAQILIRWQLDRGFIVTPKATEEWMIHENYNALKIKLTQEELRRIDNLDRNFRYGRAEFLRWKENQDWREFFDFEDDLWVKQQF